AVGGIVLGIADVAGWAIFLFPMVEQRLERTTAEFAPDLAALEGLDPAINRAMRANVVVENRGSGGLFDGKAIGSGVILKIENGEALILTNRHVVDRKFEDGDSARMLDDLKDARLRVQVIGQSFEPARVIWIAPSGIDAALVSMRLWTTEAQAAIWSKGTPVHVGEPVFAIGNPQNLTWTHTQGTISQFRTQGSGAGRIRIIQTQTAINQGNSGGGLYTKSGRLIGINTWTSDKSQSEGLSFAISLDSILDRSPPGVPDKSAEPAGEVGPKATPANKPQP
ncbi:MAG TPA: trypsin-like peptidase domain-containing protein, partial [Pirellulales bacterium]|nr:trypsin-like peptidase domain-containing protein [Pirellulales bacterium]